MASLASLVRLLMFAQTNSASEAVKAISFPAALSYCGKKCERKGEAKYELYQLWLCT